MTAFMAACYQGNINEAQKGLKQEISEKEVYNSLVMCREGHKHNPENDNYIKIMNAIKEKYPNEIKPHSGKYAEFVLLDCRGPRAKYSLYENGESKGLIS